ncbi:hypothetical protein J2739_005398 [Variovorax soli]|uniref:Uncharacterized protein n=1 Tax=Variovorax soli TaxID=376815 RepID=A0ABU1NMD4_9BURK|nr:hypothetical protein [Variovorax soli]
MLSCSLYGLRERVGVRALGARFGLALVPRPEPGCRPGGRVTFFVSPKKVTKERRPHWACPCASLRATCGARFRRGPRKLASLKHARPLIRLKLRSSARAEGRWVGPSLRSAANGLASQGLEHVQAHLDGMYLCSVSEDPQRGCSRIPQKDAPWRVEVEIPSGRSRGAQLFADQGRACLSEASLRGPREKRAPQASRSEAQGRGQWGRLFFGYFLLAKQKKVTRLPGRHPGSSLGTSATLEQRPRAIALQKASPSSAWTRAC